MEGFIPISKSYATKNLYNILKIIFYLGRNCKLLGFGDINDILNLKIVGFWRVP